MSRVNKTSVPAAKLRSIAAYIFFGGCTTCVNIVSYYVCSTWLGVTNVPSTIAAWVIAVLFAMVTNKLYVFGSKSFTLRVILWELATFYLCRIFTGVLDVAVMYVAVDLCNSQPMAWKVLSNILVIIINYVCSKLIIFKDRQRKEDLP